MTRSILPPEKFIFGSAVLCFVFLYFLFYPSIYAFRDEASYLSMAYALRTGNFFLDKTLGPLQSWMTYRGHKVFDYPLGMPFFLLPFITFGWRAIFMAGLLSHLAGSLYFKKLLTLFKIDHPVLPLLYLFYPGFVFYSRTIMSDVPAAALFITGVYYYFQSGSPDWKAGTFFASSFLFRPSALVFIFPFAIGGLWRNFSTGKVRSSLFFLFPLGFSLFLIGLYQYFFYGSPWLSAYSQKFLKIPNFSIRYYPENLRHYFIALMTSYPLMVMAPFAASKTRRPEILVSLLAGVLFFGAYYFHDRFETGFQTSVLGARFLFPAAALFLLIYAEALDNLLKRLRGFAARAFSWLLSFLLLLSALFVHSRHQQVLKNQATMKETIYSSTPEGSALIYDGNAAELLQEVWGGRKYIYWRDGENDLRDYLHHADFKKGIYLIHRNDQPGNFSLSWVPSEGMAQIKKEFDVRQIAKYGELEIYQFYERPH